jgi:hypothetical protein
MSGHDPAPSLVDVGVDVVRDGDAAPFTSPSPFTSTSTSTARVAES